MSFQLTVLKVLAGHPEGRASIAELKQCVAVLMTSGADWSRRMKLLSARAPALDIFLSGYVVREDYGWEITALGRKFLAQIETPPHETELVQGSRRDGSSDDMPLPTNVIELADRRVRRLRRCSAADDHRHSLQRSFLEIALDP